MKRALVFMMMAVFLLTSTASFAKEAGDEPSGNEILLDLPIRVLGVGATLMGTVVFFPALIFTIPTGSVGLSARKLIVEPFKFSFVRPLGESRTNYDSVDY